MLAATSPATSQAENIRFDLTETQHWRTVNDTVMGGVSSSRFYHQPECGVFEGEVSLKNNGGFASIRRLISPDFTSGSIIQLTVKGDGRRYQFRLKTHGLYEGAAYVAEFETEASEWQLIQLTEQDFTPRFRGRYIDDAPPLKFGDTIQMGFLIADKIEGKFKLQVKAIDALHAI